MKIFNVTLRGLRRVACRVFCLMGILVLTAGSGPGARAGVLWGANGHPYSAYHGVSIEQQVAYLADLGLKSYRVNVSDVRDLGPLIEAARPFGISILPMLMPPVDLQHETTEALFRKSYDLAFAMVSRYKSDIRVWELGNELENYALIRPCEMKDDGKQYNCGWGIAGGVGELDYFGPRWAKVSAVLRGLSEGTIAADPAARKAIGTAGWGHIGAFKRMANDGIQWDISAWHFYSEDPEWALKELVKFGKPIWLTEFNNPMGSKESAARQAEGLARWIKRIRALAPVYNIEAAHIYELMDETYWVPDFEAYMGLVELVKDGNSWRPGMKKPAYDIVKRLMQEDTEATSSISSNKPASPQ